MKDALKTRVQTWDLIPRDHHSAEARPLLDAQRLNAQQGAISRPSTLQIAKEAYQVEGLRVFFRGLGVCNARAFFVNAVQFFVSGSRMYIPVDSQLTNTITGIRMDDEDASFLIVGCYLIRVLVQSMLFGQAPPIASLAIVPQYVLSLTFAHPTSLPRKMKQFA